VSFAALFVQPHPPIEKHPDGELLVGNGVEKLNER
jgi:hypothetical protein